MQESLHQELKFAVVCTVILNLIFWIISLFFVKFRIDVISGLLLGSSGMLLNLFLLRRTILNAVRFGKTKDWTGYLVRCLIASVVIMISLFSAYVNTLTAVLPFLYPKLIFGVFYQFNNQSKGK